MNTLENNRLIAEFMNYNLEIVNNEVYFTHDDMLESLSDEELHYDTDWNWLMEVVEKISDILHYSLNATLDFLSEKQESDGLYTKEEVYNACVEFIKWYNENK
jgi:hypothetical protein